ncbi:TerC family protein [Buchnera aphidicola]|uniref:TerC family protein n=1 Tax=Buchnera aphidicola TaxID=9 RepID=UPI0005C71BE0
MRISKDVNNKKFIVINEKFCITLLLLSLITIELTDIIFEVDSVPAIFSINNDFLLYFLIIFYLY